MRTTIDIPDALFRQAKRVAVERGYTLKELVTKAVVHELETQKTAAMGQRRMLPAIRVPSNAPILNLSSEEMAQLDSDDELKRFL